MQAIGGSLMILGGLAFGFRMRSYPALDSGVPASAHEADQSDTMPRQWEVGIWLSAVAALGAVILFAARGENPIVLAAWLAGILCLLAAQLQGIRLHWPRVARREWAYLAALLLLLVAALLTRTYHLATLPYNLDGDFAEVGNQARALATGQQRQIFAYGWAVIPMLGYLPPWTTMLLFGTGLVGLNASGVIEGLLIIVGVYLLGQELFSTRAGLLASAFLTVSYTHLAASRQAVYIDPAFFMLFATYLLLIGLKRNRGWAVVASGIMTALCLQIYYAGRLIIPLAALALLYGLLFHRLWLLAHWRSLLMWPVALLITLGPMLVVFARAPGALAEHTKEVFILDPGVVRHMEGVYGVSTIREMLLQQVRHTALLFNYYPDKGTQFALTRPYLDPFGAVLFTLGIGYALLRWRQLGAWLMLTWISLGVVFGCFLTVNPPFWPRLIILLPPVALMVGLSFDLLYEYVRVQANRFGRSAGIALPVIVALAIFGTGVLNWNAYVDAKGTFALPRTRIGRYVADQPASARAYLVSNDFTYHDREFNFLIPGRLVANLTPQQAEASIAPVGSPTLLIVTPENTDLVKKLEQRYAGGPIGGNTPGEIAFYVFHLP
jgi:4-amino-4-deoxy-L-arabinose transferase-like glycosyltransferase